MNKYITAALSNLLTVDTQISRLSEVCDLDNESYYLQLYRVATTSLREDSNELEILSVRLIQSVVLYETVDLDDIDYGELRAYYAKQIESRYKLLGELK